MRLSFNYYFLQHFYTRLPLKSKKQNKSTFQHQVILKNSSLGESVELFQFV